MNQGLVQVATSDVQAGCDHPRAELDPRCNSWLYEQLLEAARLIQSNQYEESRNLVRQAFDLVGEHG